MQYTSGPWEVEKDDEIFGRYRLVGMDHHEMSRLDECFDEQEEFDKRDQEARERDEGNRRIIEAAPDTYEALKDSFYALTIQYANTGAVDDCRRLENAKEAIRKVEGRK